MIGREEHAEEHRRRPKPIAKWNVTGFESISVDDVASDEGGQERNEDYDCKEEVGNQEVRNAQVFGGAAGFAAKCRKILRNGLDGEDDES